MKTLTPLPPSDGPIIIAEVKPWSPFGKPLTKNTWDEQLELAILTGHVISIHTHPLWKGSFDLLWMARKRTSKPILAKGFHGTDDEVSRALDAGADLVLVVGRYPEKNIESCVLEPLTLDELAKIPPSNYAAWNSRDLSNLKELPGIPQFLLKRWSEMGAQNSPRPTFAEARGVFKGKLCQASNLKTTADIAPGADAVLVGTNLECFAASMGIRI